MKRKLFVILVYCNNAFGQNICNDDACRDQKIQELQQALLLMHEKFDKLTKHIQVIENSEGRTLGNRVVTSAYGQANPETNGIYNFNESTSAGQDAIITSRVHGGTSGDPFVSLDVKGVTGWSLGLDNSDDDKFKIANRWDKLDEVTRLTITRAGQVGIGTSNPAHKLQVEGNLKASSISTGSINGGLWVKATEESGPDRNGIYVYNEASGSAILSSRVNGSNAGDPFVSLDVKGVTGWSVGIDNSDDDSFKISNDWQNINSNTRFKLTRNGNVEIHGNLKVNGFQRDDHLCERRVSKSTWLYCHQDEFVAGIDFDHNHDGTGGVYCCKLSTN